MSPEWREVRIQGRFGWKARPLTLDDFDSNLVSMANRLDGDRWLDAGEWNCWAANSIRSATDSIWMKANDASFICVSEW